MIFIANKGTAVYVFNNHGTPYKWLPGTITLITGPASVLEGSGAENLEKLHHMRLNLRAFLVIYHPLMFL